MRDRLNNKLKIGDVIIHINTNRAKPNFDYNKIKRFTNYNDGFARAVLYGAKDNIVFCKDIIRYNPMTKRTERLLYILSILIMIVVMMIMDNNKCFEGLTQ